MRAWIASKGVRRTEPEFELRDALREPGCAICRLAARTAVRQMDIISYEAVNDIDVRGRLRAARGFCNRHAWQFLEELRDPLGTALIYRDVVNTLTTLISSRAAPAGLTWLSRAFRPAGERQQHPSLARELTASEGCSICAWQEETEETYLALLGARLHEPEFLAAWKASDRLCWPHLLRALERAASAPALSAFVESRAEDADAEPAVGPAPSPSGGAVPDEMIVAGLALEYGHLQAERSLLPPALIVDVQRRRLDDVVRTGLSADLDCPVCGSLQGALLAQSRAALRRLGASRSQREDRETRTGDERQEPRAALAPGEPEDHGLPLDVGALCSSHAWSLFALGRESMAGPIGHLRRARGQALKEAADRASRERPGIRVPGEPEARRLGKATAAALRVDQACPICAERNELSARGVVEFLGEHAAGGASGGPLCLAHLLLACGQPTHRDEWQSLLVRQARAWRELSAALAEFARKHDYRFRHEPRGAEQASPWRAVAQIAGPREPKGG